MHAKESDERVYFLSAVLGTFAVKSTKRRGFLHLTWIPGSRFSLLPQI